MESSGRLILKKNTIPMQLCQFEDSTGKSRYSLLPMTQTEIPTTKEIKKIASGDIKIEVDEENINFVEIFCCDKCNMIFRSESLLLNHKLIHVNTYQQKRNMKLKKFCCTLCNFTCLKQKSLEAHSWKHTVKEKALSCDLTTSTRKKVEEEIQDMQEHQNLCKYSECDYKTIGRDDLQGNLIRHEEKKSEKMLSCSQCDFQCKRKSIMSGHVYKKHQPLNPKDGFQRCNVCNLTCTKRSTLYAHRRYHRIREVSNEYTCDICGFKTKKKTSIYSHITRKHRNITSNSDQDQVNLFFCSQCDYKNKNKYELKVHVTRKHTDDFKFSCETCGKKFKVKGDLTNHTRFTHREQPVICDVCGKTCMNSNSLYVHQKFAHYKAKYECQICKRRMVSQENLNEHMLKQHEKREIAVCEECGKTFSRNSRLKIHMRIHTGDKPYSCTICKKSFARRTALKQHLLIHTGVRPYVCDICGKAFTQKPGLISHRKSHPGSHPPLPRVLIDHILNDVMNS